jgi:hypothetical protein
MTNSEERHLVISPSDLTFAINTRQSKIIRLSYQELGVSFAMNLTPYQARSFAISLLRKADEAEGKEPFSGIYPEVKS